MADLKPKLNGAQREELRQHIRKNDLDAVGIAAKYGIAMSTVNRYYRSEGISNPTGRPRKEVEAIKSDALPPMATAEEEQIAPKEHPKENIIGVADLDKREELKIEELVGSTGQSSASSAPDPSRDWCGTCEQRGNLVYLDRKMKRCPGCGGGLIWG